MVPYSVAVNLVEVARLFVPEWNVTLEQRYGHTLQESWRTYQRNPARYTVAWMDVAMSQSTRVLREKLASLSGYPTCPSSPGASRLLPACVCVKENCVCVLKGRCVCEGEECVRQYAMLCLILVCVCVCSPLRPQCAYV